MKRFHFALERVRKWRQDQADIEEMRLQHLHTEMRALDKHRKEIVEEADRSRRAVLAQHYVTSEDLGALDAFREYTAEQLRRLDAKKAVLAPRIAEQKERMLEAHRGFQLVDGLRDRALLAWTAALDKEQETLAAELHLAGRIRESRKREVRESRSPGVKEARLNHLEGSVLP